MSKELWRAGLPAMGSGFLFFNDRFSNNYNLLFEHGEQRIEESRIAAIGSSFLL